LISKDKKYYYKNKLRRSNDAELQKIFCLRNSIRRAKQRSIRNGLDFDLDFEWIFKNNSGKCPVLNIDFEYCNKIPCDNSPSIDRINNNKGYTKDNCIVISNRANTIKNNSTPDELLKIGKFYKKLLATL
jgi:hypothetical protein